MVPSTLPSSSPSAKPDERRQFFWIPADDRRQFFWVPADDRRQFFWIPEPVQPLPPPTQPPDPGRGAAELDLVHHCLQSDILVDEDFEEEGSEDFWTHGSSSHSKDLTFFLGRLDGVYNPKVSRLFNMTKVSSDGIRSQASNATIEFVLYTIDDWQPTDAIYVVIGTTTINLGIFQSSVQVDTYINETMDGISWWRSILMQGSNLGFGDTDDKKHLVEFTIPSDHFFPNGSLYFEVRIETERGDINTLSAGIDDFILEAYYNCSGLCHRKLGHAEGIEGTGHGITRASATSSCKADDFPCQQNGKDETLVYICHYSQQKGYKTLCIPEQDSVILHFYMQDYCGPCVGGFTGASCGTAYAGL